jgi:hypothetical protein
MKAAAKKNTKTKRKQTVGSSERCGQRWSSLAMRAAKKFLAPGYAAPGPRPAPAALRPRIRPRLRRPSTVYR